MSAPSNAALQIVRGPAVNTAIEDDRKGSQSPPSSRPAWTTAALRPRPSCDPGPPPSLPGLPSSTSRPGRKDVMKDPAGVFKLPANPRSPSLAPEQRQSLENIAAKSEKFRGDVAVLSARSNAALQIVRGPATINNIEDDKSNCSIGRPKLHNGPQDTPHYDRGTNQDEKQAGAELSVTKTLKLTKEGGHRTPFSKINQTEAALATTTPSKQTRAENKQARAELGEASITRMKQGGGLGTSLIKIARKMDTQATTTTLGEQQQQKKMKISEHIARFNKMEENNAEKRQTQQVKTNNKKTTTKKTTKQQKTSERDEKQPKILPMFKKLEETTPSSEAKQEEKQQGDQQTTTTSTQWATNTTTAEATRVNKTNNPETPIEARKFTKENINNKQQQLSTKTQQQQKKQASNKRKKQQQEHEETQQQAKITRFMMQDKQPQPGETTTTTFGREQQQHQTERKPTKLMVKSKGIEIPDLKEFLERKKIERAARLGEKQNKSNSSQLHTQLKNCDFQRAHRPEGIVGRDEIVAMGSSAVKGD